MGWQATPGGTLTTCEGGGPRQLDALKEGGGRNILDVSWRGWDEKENKSIFEDEKVWDSYFLSQGGRGEEFKSWRNT